MFWCQKMMRPTWFFHEIYRDRAAFDLHLTQPHFHTFERDAEHLMIGKPQITFLSAYLS